MADPFQVDPALAGAVRPAAQAAATVGNDPFQSDPELAAQVPPAASGARLDLTPGLRTSLQAMALQDVLSASDDQVPKEVKARVLERFLTAQAGEGTAGASLLARERDVGPAQPEGTQTPFVKALDVLDVVGAGLQVARGLAAIARTGAKVGGILANPGALATTMPARAVWSYMTPAAELEELGNQTPEQRAGFLARLDRTDPGREHFEAATAKFDRRDKVRRELKAMEGRDPHRMEPAERLRFAELSREAEAFADPTRNPVGKELAGLWWDYFWPTDLRDPYSMGGAPSPIPGVDPTEVLLRAGSGPDVGQAQREAGRRAAQAGSGLLGAGALSVLFGGTYEAQLARDAAAGWNFRPLLEAVGPSQARTLLLGRLSAAESVRFDSAEAEYRKEHGGLPIRPVGRTLIRENLEALERGDRRTGLGLFEAAATIGLDPLSPLPPKRLRVPGGIVTESGDRLAAAAVEATASKAAARHAALTDADVAAARDKIALAGQQAGLPAEAVKEAAYQAGETARLQADARGSVYARQAEAAAATALARLGGGGGRANRIVRDGDPAR